MRELFKANKLKIASRCINTIQELETYSYPDKKPGKNEYEDPIKENDHAMDALRYAIMMTVTSTAGKTAHQFIPGSLAMSNRQIARKGPDMPQSQAIPNRAHQYKPRFSK